MLGILSVLLFTALSTAEESNIFWSIEVGQSKTEIKALLNEPYEIKTFEKTGKPIWGPEEEFWDRIPNGTLLEVWRYRNEHGHLNLYFIDGDEFLKYKAFAPRGVVYEPGR